MPIDSPHNQHVRLARSLRSTRARRETGLFLAEGPRVVGEALMYAPDIQWVAWCPQIADEDTAELADAVAEAGILLYELTPRAFASLSDAQTPQGIAAVIRIPSRSLSAISSAASPCRFLVLHDVQDPGNAGTMIRTADAFAFAGVVFCGECVDPYQPKVVRSSAGSLFHLPIVETTWREVVGWAGDQGLGLVALDLDAEHELGKVPLPPRMAVVVGNEARGLPAQILQDVAMRVRIPMPGRAESLNAAAAVAVIAYEATRAA